MRSSTRWLTLLLLFMACSWGVALARQEHAAKSHDVSISGFKFQPDTLTVHVGDTVQWKNSDIVPHTVTATDKSFASSTILPGATWKLVVKKGGHISL
jgi:plastocyanin